MRAICTIAKRDFLSILKSPMFFILAAVCSMLWSFVYLRTLFQFAALTNNPMAAQQQGMANIHFGVFMNHISLVHLIMVFAVPAFTMWLLSQEKKQRTYDLLLTSPVTATEIALGKFLGGWGIVLALISISTIYPIATGLVAEFSWPTLFSALLGVVVISGLYVSLGLFASSLTESPILSFLLGILFILMVFMGTGSIPAEGEMATAIVNQISIVGQFTAFLKGQIKISAVVYFVSVMSFFVFLTQRVVESSRWR